MVLQKLGRQKSWNTKQKSEQWSLFSVIIVQINSSSIGFFDCLQMNCFCIPGRTVFIVLAQTCPWKWRQLYLRSAVKLNMRCGFISHFPQPEYGGSIVYLKYFRKKPPKLWLGWVEWRSQIFDYAFMDQPTIA